jgi:hypothetical protein
VGGHGGLRGTRQDDRAERDKAHHADGARANQCLAIWRILNIMKPARAGTRRFLPTSPFQAPPDPPPAEQFAVQDQVTHDKHGLGRVISIENDTALVIDFGTQKVRITTPCAKLTKL